MTEFTLQVAAGPAPAVASFVEGSPWLDGDGGVCARVFRDRTRRWVDWHSVGLFSIPETHTNVRVWPAERAHADAVRDCFERRLQPLLFQARGFQTLHASAVCSNAGTIALTGKTGSGKSTLAYALRRAGYEQIADDAVVIDTSAQPPIVRRLPFRPQLKGTAAGLSAETIGHNGQCAIDAARLAAIVLLRQDSAAPAEPSAARLAGPAACVALMSHAHVFDPVDAADRFVSAYAGLVNAVPVFQLDYRPGMDDLPRVVAAITRLPL